MERRFCDFTMGAVLDDTGKMVSVSFGSMDSNGEPKEDFQVVMTREAFAQAMEFLKGVAENYKIEAGDSKKQARKAKAKA